VGERLGALGLARARPCPRVGERDLRIVAQDLARLPELAHGLAELARLGEDATEGGVRAAAQRCVGGERDGTPQGVARRLGAAEARERLAELGP
jgi:hypothetical protein